jgi:putative ABC transport system permease protein
MQALRVFTKTPGFAAAAVLTLAVGIGANTAIFTVTNAVLLRPLAYAQPDGLVVLSAEHKLAPAGLGPMSWPRFTFLLEQSRSFSSLAAFAAETFNLTGRGDPEQVRAARVSHNFFPVLGVPPAWGRVFRPDEDRPGGEPVVMLGHEFCSRQFGGAAAAIGQHLTLDAKDYTVIGVLPVGFRFDFLGSHVDIWAPRLMDFNLTTPQQVQAGVGFLNAVARLRPGTAIAGAQSEMDALAAQYRSQNPKMPDADPALVLRVSNLRDRMVANVRPALLILFGAVTLVLLIACANVASLLLSRALGRKREIAVRAAMGATRGGIVRQLLAESLMLALLGGAAGTLLSSWGTRFAATMAAGSLPRAEEIRTDVRVLAFALVVSLGAGVLFGLVPALQLSRADLSSVLRSEGRGATSGRRQNRLRNLLVVSQVALSVVLLIGAGLLIRNLAQMRSGSQGFDQRHLLTLNLALPPARYSGGVPITAFFDGVLRELRALPGVVSATAASALPANPKRISPALAEGQPAVPLAERPLFNIQMIAPEYAATMRIPLLRGREFTARDDARAPLVAMVNEAVVRRYWPNADPIGKHILLGRIPQPVEVVGVLGDVRNVDLAQDAAPEICVPLAQRPWSNMNLIVRTAGDPHAMTAAVRARVLAIDRDQPITSVQSMDELLESAAAQPRFTTSLLGALSATALLLAIMGIYGVIAYSVAERTGEMGIRMALGAERRDILRMVVLQGLTLAGCGVSIGVVAALALTRWMAGLLYHVSATDPLTFVACAVLFTTVACCASYLPARRATRVDPMVALRHE